VGGEFLAAHADFVGVGKFGDAVADERVEGIGLVGEQEPAGGFEAACGGGDGLAPIEGVVERFKNNDGVEGGSI